jgi:hypothetical protein
MGKTVVGVVALSAVALSGLALPSTPAAVAEGPGAAPTSSRVFGWGFDDPSAVVVAGGDLYVANSLSNSVTEVAASTGRLLRVISGPVYRFDAPHAMATHGAEVFVANNAFAGSAAAGPVTAPGTGSVTELNASTGALVRVISGPAH